MIIPFHMCETEAETDSVTSPKSQRKSAAELRIELSPSSVGLNNKTILLLHEEAKGAEENVLMATLYV